MSHKIDRIQLIRERHRKLILEPRRRQQEAELFTDLEEDDLETLEDEFLARHYFEDEDEEFN